MEYSCYHLLNFDEFLSLKHLKNVETSEVRNKVEELVEVLVDTALFIIFLALDCYKVELFLHFSKTCVNFDQK